MKIEVSRPDVVLSPPKKSRKRLYLILAVVVILVVIVLAIIGSLAPSPTPSPIAITGVSGTNFVVPGGSYSHFDFTLSSQARITGAFTANPGVTFYIVTQGEPIYFTGPDTYLYTTGYVASASVDTNLQSGSYQLIFNNEVSNTTSISVQLSQQFNATYVG
jgi:hypothetical protein